MRQQEHPNDLYVRTRPPQHILSEPQLVSGEHLLPAHPCRCHLHSCMLWPQLHQANTSVLKALQRQSRSLNSACTCRQPSEDPKAPTTEHIHHHHPQRSSSSSGQVVQQRLQQSAPMEAVVVLGCNCSPCRCRHSCSKWFLHPADTDTLLGYSNCAAAAGRCLSMPGALVEQQQQQATCMAVGRR